MLIACSFSSKGLYRPLNGTEQLTKDRQHGSAPTPLSGCCTPTRSSFKDSVPFILQFDVEKLACLGCWMNFLTLLGFVGHRSPAHQRVLVSDSGTVPVNNESEPSAIVSCNQPLLPPSPYSRGSHQGKVQFLAHRCLCTSPSGLGSCKMMNVVSHRASRNSDKAALSKHAHEQCKQIKIVADN